MGHGDRAEAAMMRSGVLILLALLAGTCPAGAESDQDAARSAVEAGQALPLQQILDRAHRQHPGLLLEVELKPAGDRLIYEVRILAKGGHIEEWRYDARIW